MSTILSFSNKINVSLQVTDQLYYNNTIDNGGYQVSATPTLIGEVLNVERRDNIINRNISYIADDQQIEFDVIFKTYDGNYVPTIQEEFIVTLNGVVTNNFTFTPGGIEFLTPLNLSDVVNIELLYYIEVDDSLFVNPPGNPLTAQSFISFLKNNKINKKSVKGYYAEVKLVNNSHEKAELFSVGSEISESSK